MTEVALGLSMAFFSLLILALLSITAGTETDQLSKTVVQTPASAEQAVTENAITALLAQSRLSLSDANIAQEERSFDSTNSAAAGAISFVFYYRGQYFDAKLQPQMLQNLSTEKSTVVAVLPDLSFAEVMQVHKDFKDKDIQITAMDDNWQRAFAQLANDI